MHRLPLPLLLAVLLVIGAACQPAPAATLTLRGLATAGPTCPVERNPPDPACADRPVAGARIEARSGGQVVAETVTDHAGRFALRLAPGRYAIVPGAVEGLLGTAAPVDVTLAEGTLPAELVLSYDTGIR